MDHAQHSGVKRIAQCPDVGVRAIRGHGVLGQVVGAHAEKVNLRRQLIGDHGRRRHLDHDPDLDALAAYHAGAMQFGLGAAQNRLGSA